MARSGPAQIQLWIRLFAAAPSRTHIKKSNNDLKIWTFRKSFFLLRASTVHNCRTVTVSVQHQCKQVVMKFFTLHRKIIFKRSVFSVNGRAVEQCIVEQALVPRPIFILLMVLTILSIVCIVALVFAMRKLATYKKLAPFNFGIYRYARLFESYLYLFLMIEEELQWVPWYLKTLVLLSDIRSLCEKPNSLQSSSFLIHIAWHPACKVPYEHFWTKELWNAWA